MRHADRSPNAAHPAIPAQRAPAQERRGGEVDWIDGVGRFAGRVAHDLNNFLMVIRSETELAALDLPAEHPAREALANVCDAVDRATAFTSRLHALNPAGGHDHDATDLNALVVRVGAMVPGGPAPISVVTECVPGALLVRAGPETLLTVLRDLVTNACEAMPSGGSLRVATRTIQLGRARATTYQTAPGPFGVLSVTDTGQGMSEEVRARLFEPFLTTKSRADHVGLGLAMSFATVRRAGGFLEVESQPSHGTSVQIYLPCADDVTADNVPASPVDTGTGRT